MAALTAASWTVTIDQRWRTAGMKHIIGRMALANTDTYPTGGIPLPDIGQLGLVRGLHSFAIQGGGGGYQWVWDKTNHKLQVFEEEGTAAGGPLLEADTSEVPGNRTLNFYAIGW